jgi:aminoglycoside 6'-N-acetyltransferase I
MIDNHRLQIRQVREADFTGLAAMRAALWPEEGPEAHERDLRLVLESSSAANPYIVLVAEVDGHLVGFADVSLRSRADGCDPRRPAGYLEGWFVAEERRREGIGSALVRTAEEWAREMGCTEMASDTWIDNVDSQRAHEALGFEVVSRVVTFRRSL